MRIMTITQFCEANPAFSENAIRALIFDRKANGFDSVIRRIGRRVLISEDDFAEWLAARGPSAGRPRTKPTNHAPEAA